MNEETARFETSLLTRYVGEDRIDVYELTFGRARLVISDKADMASYREGW